MLFTRNLKSKSKAGHEATRQWRKRWLFGMLWLSSLLLARQPATTAPQQPKAQSFRISGTIVDAITGAILSHARISVAPVTKRDDLRSVITGEDGQFSFDGLQRGKYSLIAQHRGYLTQAFNQHDQYASAVAVGPDIESEHLVFRMRPDASITGKVLDESNEPVRDARVMAFSTFIQAGTLGTHLRSFAVTDDQGRRWWRPSRGSASCCACAIRGCLPCPRFGRITTRLHSAWDCTFCSLRRLLYRR